MGPSVVMGPIWDTIIVSCAVIAGAMCEEYGRCVNMGLLHPLLRLVRAYPFTSLVVIQRAYRSWWSPLTPTFCILKFYQARSALACILENLA
jgi:hypothetical protein